MPWLFLALAVALDIVGTVALKLSDGLTRLWPSVMMLGCYLLSLGALACAIKEIDLSLAYSLWAGVGTALTVLVGIWWFKEPVTALKLASVLLIILGIVGLNLGET
ncbi:MAG: QacE family quaternary ammonium compound efflux SMR transporter [Bacteroidetes bacterium]|nr:MAG: QacE family quaternary ammonium compound efflux SMR transporter [Bacteroidota bacterium]